MSHLTSRVIKFFIVKTKGCMGLVASGSFRLCHSIRLWFYWPVCGSWQLLPEPRKMIWKLSSLTLAGNTKLTSELTCWWVGRLSEQHSVQVSSESFPLPVRAKMKSKETLQWPSTWETTQSWFPGSLLENAVPRGWAPSSLKAALPKGPCWHSCIT